MEHKQALGIAIIGMACRLPGATDWRNFWRNICDGVESVSFFSDAELLAAGVDPNYLRDPDYVKAGFVLPEPDGFDTAFFGFSPHEARLLDPQQRLMLESAWEAFEDAGILPGQGAGPVGVYGASGSVVTSYLMNELDDQADAHGQTANLLHQGNDKDFPATRVSYKLNLTGPSINVNTACSSSLVLLHLACQAIRHGECKMALATASTVRVPQVAGYHATKGGIMSPEGRIRTFDANAQGTVFSSGVASVLLKEVNAALADGDHIYAVIQSTAINNDGARKKSYSGTCVEGQAEAMAAALAASGFPAASIGYAECHGTGTVAGDPIEVAALTRAFGPMEGKAGKCLIGSVKPNIGHSEQSAGLASLIKAALILEQGIIPATLNCHNPNSRIDFEHAPFAVAQQLTPWPASPYPRRVLVNGLGIGGTNAVAILEQAPAAPVQSEQPEQRPAHVLLLSAKSAAALAHTAARQLEFLHNPAQPQPALADICHTLATGRSHFTHRFAAVLSSPDQLRQHLSSLASAKPNPANLGTANPAPARKIAFLYTGQGAQVVGMGQQLYQSNPGFRTMLDHVAQLMRPWLDRPLLSVLFASGDDAALIGQTRYTQPALFAIEVSLAHLLGTWGIVPAAVAGHSIGEFAAACLAGVYTLEQAARLCCERGRLMQALPAGGTMVAVFAPETALAPVLATLDPTSIGIAAVNSTQGSVISGATSTVQEAVAQLGARGISTQPLAVSHAFHSPLMEPMLAKLAKCVQQIAGKKPVPAPTISWVSSFTGKAMASAPDADYWCQQARGTVRFADAIQSLLAMGITDFIEIGPGKTLLTHGAANGSASTDLAWLPTLGKGEAEWENLLGTLARLYQRGHTIDWAALDAPWQYKKISLPGYAFERQRVWFERTAANTSAAANRLQGKSTRFLGNAPGNLAANAPACGTRLASPLPALQFELVYGDQQLPWLSEHRMHDAIVLPTTAALLAALTAASQMPGNSELEIVDFSYHHALVLADDEQRLCHLVLEPTAKTGFTFALSGFNPATNTWSAHLQGQIQAASGQAPQPEKWDADSIRRRCTQPVVADRYYAVLKRLGLGYGPAFRGVQSLWRGNNEALARVRLPDQIALPVQAGLPHPALLDACLHVYPALIDAHGNFSQMPPESTLAWLPVGMARCQIKPCASRELWVYAKLRAQPRAKLHNQAADSAIADIVAWDQSGQVVLHFEGISLKPLAAELFRPTPPTQQSGWLYRMQWIDAAPITNITNITTITSSAPNPPTTPAAPATLHWLLLGGDTDGSAAALEAALVHLGASCKRLTSHAIPKSEQALSRLLRTWSGQAASTGIVSLLGIDAAPTANYTDDAQQRQLFGGTLTLIRSLLAARAEADAGVSAGSTTRLYLATRNACAVTPESPPVNVLAAGLWGLARTLALEVPGLRPCIIDLQANAALAEEAAQLAQQLLANGTENQIALRNGHSKVLRLQRQALPALSPASGQQADSPGAWLVTGGLGALGLEVASWLAQHRPVHTLVLASRQGARAANAAQARRMLEALGVKVLIVKADVSNPQDVKKLLAKLGKMTPPLVGIYHVAGVLADALLEQMDWPRFQQVLHPKLNAAWFLHQYSQGSLATPLREFVLFSSILSVIGSAGQTNYTSANACLDALAAHRQGLGLPALSVNWGPWAGAGMAGALGEHGEAVWRARGLHFIAPELGRSAFDGVFDGLMRGLMRGQMTGLKNDKQALPLHQAAVAVFDWPTFLRQFPLTPAFYAELHDASSINSNSSTTPKPGASADVLRKALATSDPVQRRAALSSFLSHQSMSILGLAEPANPSRPLRELGLDSLMAIDLVNSLDSAVGVRMPMAKLIVGPSIDELIAQVWPDLAGLPSAPVLNLATATQGSASEYSTNSAADNTTNNAANHAPGPATEASPSQGSWLVTVVASAKPRFRLFCFPFAGGGSAAFQAWGQALDDSIEVIAIEAPGRLARIHEAPVREIGQYVAQVIDAMRERLDLPFAFFGHCLGGLTLYEVARSLLQANLPRPSHLFCSGARAPDRLDQIGPFEKTLIEHIKKVPGYQKTLPVYNQPEQVFAEVIRHFDMTASQQFLDDPELRRLMLPAVRAEFEMVSNYRYQRERPWDLPITCFVAKGDPYVSRQDILAWGRFTNRQLQVYMREGTHFSLFEDAAFIQRVISRELLAPLT